MVGKILKFDLECERDRPMIAFLLSTIFWPIFFFLFKEIFGNDFPFIFGGFLLALLRRRTNMLSFPWMKI